MTHEESIQAAEAILLQAGWRPHPDWGRFTRGTLVCGVQPDGSAIHVKDWARIPPGHPLYGPDTPDEPHEAAAWLVARFGPKPLADEGEAGDISPEEWNEPHEIDWGPPVGREYDPAHEAHGETGAEREAQEGEAELSGDVPEGLQDGDAGLVDGADAGRGGGAIERIGLVGEEWADQSGSDDGVVGATESDELEPLDADFTDPDDPAEIDAAIARELLESDGHDLGEELLDEPAHMSGEDIVRVYGLDDLDRRKTVAIGLVMRHARDLMPYWTTDHDTALRELRNHVMGAAEDRWDLIPERQAELDELEATLRRRRAIEQARDDKVAFIEAADRAAFDAFVVESDWP